MTTLATKTRPPRRDAVAESRSNPFGLPRGERLRRELVTLFRAQRGVIAHYIRTGRKEWKDAVRGLNEKAHAVGPLPAGWPDWHDFGLGAIDQEWRFTPLIKLTWDAAASAFAPQVGLDPDEWTVVNPHTERMIGDAVLAFSESTNSTTSLALDRALARTREELVEGVVKQGEALPALTKRIHAIFDGAEKWRARRIAWTETSRAVHAAQEQAAIQSGVVTGWEWLLSGDACPMCIAIAARARFVRLGHAFAVIGDNPHYSQIKFPPAHPHCNCTVVEVLDTDPQPQWADTLHQPEPATEDEHRAVAAITQARDEETLNPKPGPTVTPAPAPAPARAAGPSRRGKPAPTPSPGAPPARGPGGWQWGDVTDPSLPIRRRIQRAPSAERTRQIVLVNAKALEAKDAHDRVAAERTRVRKQLADGVTAQTLSDAERQRLVAEMLGLEASAKALLHALGVERNRVAMETGKLLATPPGVARFGWTHQTAALNTPNSQSAFKAAQPIVSQLVAAGLAQSASGMIYWRTLGPHEEQRANTTDAGEIRLAKDGGAATAIHEWGHQIEHQVPGVKAAADEFLHYRTRGGALRKMNELDPGKNYKADEDAWEDKFDRAFGLEGHYCGKRYDDATEIISMGLEKLYNDPGGFARDDPEYCTFVLGILDGSLRKP